MTATNSEEAFANHPALAQLGVVLRQAREVLDRHGPTLDDTGRSRVKRVIHALEFTSEIMARADPELSLLLGTLDAVKQQLDAVSLGLSAMNAANPGGIKASIAAIDAIVAVLDRFPPRLVVDGHEELAKILSGLRDQQAAVLAEATERASSTIDAVTIAQGNAEKEIGQKLAAAAELGTTVDRLQQQVGQQSGRLDSALSAFSTSSNELEQKRESRYREWLHEQTEGIANRSAEEIAKVTDLLIVTETHAKAAVIRLEQARTEAAKILNVIGNIGATGNYKLVADENEKSANSLRNGAIALFLLLVAVVVSIAYNAIHDGFRWDVATFRLISVLILSLPAAYLARESARHREVAERARRMELELASLDAFNALLPEQERTAIKAEMARKYFGNGGQGTPESKADAEKALTVKGLLEEATSLVKAIRG
jgi:hypothetical protein